MILIYKVIFWQNIQLLQQIRLAAQEERLLTTVCIIVPMAK